MTKQERNERRSEMFALIEQWQQSKKTQTAFCREHDIVYHIFGYWLKKYRQEHGENGNFLAMQLSDYADTGIEIRYPNGIVLHLPRTIGICELKQLITI